MSPDGARRGRRMVVIDPAFLGDVVFDGVLVQALAREAPGTFVGMVVRPPADAVARRIPGVDRVHVFDKRGRDRGARGLARLAAELASEAYDTALIPHPSVRSTLLAWRARIPERVGSAPGWLARRLLTRRVDLEPGTGFIAGRLALLGGAARGATRGLAGALRGEGAAPPGGLRVGLALGSEWATKRWPPEQAAACARRLRPHVDRFVLLGASGERALYERLHAVAPELADCWEDRVGGTVDDLIEAVASCHLLIAGDTGPLHIARALGRKVVALFGPTPVGVHAFSEETDRVLGVELPCRPCGPHGHVRCPEGHHRCMVELDGDRVAEAALELLGATARGRA